LGVLARWRYLIQIRGELEIGKRGLILAETSAYNAIGRHGSGALLSKPVFFG
jgi:hypothetical protein